jgi:hypothetical protein
LSASPVAFLDAVEPSRHGLAVAADLALVAVSGERLSGLESAARSSRRPGNWARCHARRLTVSIARVTEMTAKTARGIG